MQIAAICESLHDNEILEELAVTSTEVTTDYFCLHILCVLTEFCYIVFLLFLLV